MTDPADASTDTPTEETTETTDSASQMYAVLTEEFGLEEQVRRWNDDRKMMLLLGHLSRTEKESITLATHHAQLGIRIFGMKMLKSMLGKVESLEEGSPERERARHQLDGCGIMLAGVLAGITMELEILEGSTKDEDSLASVLKQAHASGDAAGTFAAAAERMRAKRDA